MTACDRSTQVHAYHDRQLGPAAREAFEAHLAECPACAQLLAEVRAVSRFVVSAKLPEAGLAPSTFERYYDAWDVVDRGRGVLRISSWLTAAAAAVLVGSLVLVPARPVDKTESVAVVNTDWEATALMPPPERGVDRPDQFVELAQWMAEDLSDGGFQQP